MSVPDKNGQFVVDPKLAEELKGEVVVIKYGGNAMVDEEASNQVFQQIRQLTLHEIHPVLVHGGGPAIQRLLEEVKLKAEFIGGHRKTDEKSIRYVEMALSGSVNGEIVRKLNNCGVSAVGLSGKDAGLVRARRRIHSMKVEGETREVDLGYVGDVDKVDTRLIGTLLNAGYTPVIAPIAVGEDGLDYNINADMFAGHLAAALKAKVFVAMTDVDGLMKDPEDPATRVDKVSVAEVRSWIGGIVKGGMIPKVEACLAAVEGGVERACIINGTRPGTLVSELLTRDKGGTTFFS